MCERWSQTRNPRAGFLVFVVLEVEMIRETGVAVLVGLVAVAPIAAQKKAAPAAKTYDVTITADGKPYSGTMQLEVAAGKVSGKMHLTKPTEITGAPAGTTKANQMKLDFPYHMVENKCDGRIAMDITMPAKAGPAKGTVEVNGCGSTKLPGTIELVPAAAAKPAAKKSL
jgi:hypothetical protein